MATSYKKNSEWDGKTTSMGHVVVGDKLSIGSVPYFYFTMVSAMLNQTSHPESDIFVSVALFLE